MEKTKIELERGSVKVNEAQETAEPGVLCHRRHCGGAAATGARGRDERHGGDGEDCRAEVPAGAARPHSGLHVYRSADRLARD